ncbi:MAG TPA: hypothetical protein PKA58_29610 [Polyangium sp.]|nr:hypothetical protein [Polyangium sp.]
MIRFTRTFSPLFWAVACAGWALGCSDGGLSIPDLSAQHPGTPPDPPVNNGPQNPPIDTPSLVCKPDIVVSSDSRAMVVTDPEVLARFSLERVLQQIIDRANFGTSTPLQMMQQLFDTQNSEATGVFSDVVHCDDPENDAFNVAPAKFCPRAEGKLATSTGFFQANHPDSFVPVALVNRFDLTPRQGNNCGEHRIMFAKLSGQTNPNERVFLAFEGIIENPTFGDTLIGCRPVAEMWASLEKETDIKVIADRLEKFYFQGLDNFNPVVSPDHYTLAHAGDDDGGGGYGDPSGHPRRGQLRLSQGMQEPWEFREFHVQFAFEGEPRPSLFFAPVTTKNNPRPELFDPTSSLADGTQFREQIMQELPKLASKQGFGIQFAPAQPHWNAGSSMISSDASLDMVSRAFQGEKGQAFWTQIQSAIAEKQLNQGCPQNDPLLPEHLVQRVSMLTCAGCHAPEQYLGTNRSLGCGQSWPQVAQRAHIDEFGKLSPALTDSFLPRRAEVMSKYLQGCDIAAIQESLEPAEGFGGGVPPK